MLELKDKINVGEYIRFDPEGLIGIIESIEIKDDEDITNPICIKLRDDDCGLLCEKKEVKKHSKNLMDLIEKGDLVKIEDEHGEDLLLLNNSSCFNKFKQRVKNGAKITGILTHQRYNNEFFNNF